MLHILLMLAFTFAVSGGMAAIGLSHFWGDPYLSRFVTSIGPGGVFSVIAPIASLLVLALLGVPTFASTMERFINPRFHTVVAIVCGLVLFVGHAAITFLFVNLRSPDLKSAEWVVGFSGWASAPERGPIIGFLADSILVFAASNWNDGPFWVRMAPLCLLTMVTYKLARSEFFNQLALD